MSQPVEAERRTAPKADKQTQEIPSETQPETLAHKLGRRRIDFLSDVLEDIVDFKAENAADFAAIVEYSSFFGIPQADLADACEVATGTISRWANGFSVPPRYIRSHVVGQVASLGRLKLQTLKEALQAPAKKP